MPQFFLAVLDTMWGDDGVAPHWFTINPRNHSGRRLYRLTGARDGELWVTNACPQQVRHPNAHGTPSVEFLYQSFMQIPARWRTAPLLACGKVAQATYDAMIAQHAPRGRQHLRFSHRGPVVRMLHPAARTWTARELARVARHIRTLL